MAGAGLPQGRSAPARSGTQSTISGERLDVLLDRLRAHQVLQQARHRQLQALDLTETGPDSPGSGIPLAARAPRRAGVTDAPDAGTTPLFIELPREPRPTPVVTPPLVPTPRMPPGPRRCGPWPRATWDTVRAAGPFRRGPYLPLVRSPPDIVLSTLQRVASRLEGLRRLWTACGRGAVPATVGLRTMARAEPRSPEPAPPVSLPAYDLLVCLDADPGAWQLRPVPRPRLDPIIPLFDPEWRFLDPSPGTTACGGGA